MSVKESDFVQFVGIREIKPLGSIFENPDDEDEAFGADWPEPLSSQWTRLDRERYQTDNPHAKEFVAEFRHSHFVHARNGSATDTTHFSLGRDELLDRMRNLSMQSVEPDSSMAALAQLDSQANYKLKNSLNTKPSDHLEAEDIQP